MCLYFGTSLSCQHWLVWMGRGSIRLSSILLCAYLMNSVESPSACGACGEKGSPAASSRYHGSQHKEDTSNPDPMK
ncbi:hypothetical protein BCY86_07845 [Pajaroellobacter abortibovis]|uniref:C2H2-type domain-containing protein n=1 Tax=Pajaroellobacter abortibovis TaxID=1882918 RepID=A0A1L6MYE8_9BACT|nr:hypothetical protein BCY86_07845 [Pajaroellobacter abortibovis]